MRRSAFYGMLFTFLCLPGLYGQYVYPERFENCYLDEFKYEETRIIAEIDNEKLKSVITSGWDDKMLKKAESHKLIFRPHFKTHQSLEIGKWFKELGTNKITVSSLKMAEYFSCQWKDITVAFPLNILEMHTVNELAKKITLNAWYDQCYCRR